MLSTSVILLPGFLIKHLGMLVNTFKSTLKASLSQEQMEPFLAFLIYLLMGKKTVVLPVQAGKGSCILTPCTLLICNLSF